MRLAVLAAAGLLLAGCTSPKDTCALEFRAEEPDERTAIDLPANVTAAHKDLRDVMRDADPINGKTITVDCSAGLAIMDDLQANGADVRVYNDISRDTYVNRDGEPHRLGLIKTVHD